MYVCFLVFKPIFSNKSSYLVKKQETPRFTTLNVRTVVRLAGFSEGGIAKDRRLRPLEFLNTWMAISVCLSR